MYFLLITDPDNVVRDTGKPIYEIPDAANQNGYFYRLENGWDDADLFEADINEIDRRCNALLDIGDVDFFNVEQCQKLIEWIDERTAQPASSRYKELLEVLKNYCQQAIHLETGVYIDL